MTDKIRPFVRPVAEAPAEPAPVKPRGVKLGLYPLGPAEVVISLDLFHLVLQTLEEQGTPEQKRLAQTMRRNYEAPFYEPPFTPSP